MGQKIGAAGRFVHFYSLLLFYLDESMLHVSFLIGFPSFHVAILMVDSEEAADAIRLASFFTEFLTALAAIDENCR